MSNGKPFDLSNGKPFDLTDGRASDGIAIAYTALACDASRTGTIILCAD